MRARLFSAREPFDTWTCAGCRRERPWCDGGADENPDLCDACWFIVAAPPWRRLLAYVWPAPEHRCDGCEPYIHTLRGAR